MNPRDYVLKGKKTKDKSKQREKRSFSIPKKGAKAFQCFPQGMEKMACFPFVSQSYEYSWATQLCKLAHIFCIKDMSKADTTKWLEHLCTTKDGLL